MDLIVVDMDCSSLWSVPALERILGAQNDKIIFLNDKVLTTCEYNLMLAGGISEQSITRAFLFTKFQNGIMEYHKKMMHNTLSCASWSVIVLDERSEAYKKPILSSVSNLFYKQNKRFNVLFDDETTLSAAIEEKSLKPKPYPYCIIATKQNSALVERMQSLLQSIYTDWHFETHVGLQIDDYRCADRILIVGYEDQDYMVPALENYAETVRIWLGLPTGKNKEVYVQKRARHILQQLNDCGWNIGDLRDKIFASVLLYEEYFQSLRQDCLSTISLQNDDCFILWDRYGLPLTNRAYEDTRFIETFLKEQCCLSDI